MAALLSASLAITGTQAAAWEGYRENCIREARDPVLDKVGKSLVMEHPQLRPLELRSCAESGWRFARRWLIVNNSGQLMPLLYTPAQWRLARLVAKLRAANLPVRIRILKARQEGISTFCEADGYHQCRFRDHINAMVIADRKDHAENLYQMFRLYHDKLPDWMRPELEFYSRKEGLGFRDTHSQMGVYTAKDEAIGRSGNPSWVHASEVGFFPGEAEETFGGLYPSVHMKPGTTAYEESTANGVTGYYHEKWYETERLREQGKDTFWHNLFIAWWEHPDYVMPVTEREATWKMTHLDREEEFLVEKFKLTPQQLRWRRFAINDTCGGDLEKFKRDYPAFAEEAFRSSGSPFWGPEGQQVLVTWKRRQEGQEGPDAKHGYHEIPIKVCLPRQVGTELPGFMLPDGRLEGNVELRHYEIPLRVFQLPQPGVSYVIGADVAEGVKPIHQRARTRDADYSVAAVGRADTFDIVATLRGRWHPDIYAEALHQVGTMYNSALIAIEAHAIGESAITWIASPRMFRHADQIVTRPGYPRLYRRIRGKQAQLGWQTDAITRPQMLSFSRQLIRDGIGLIPDLAFLLEHLALEKLPGGKIQVRQGHDDTIIARSIMVSVIEEVKPQVAEREYAEEPTDIHGMATLDFLRGMERAQVDYEPDYEEVYG